MGVRSIFGLHEGKKVKDKGITKIKFRGRKTPVPLHRIRKVKRDGLTKLKVIK